jgi:hypothetical protein
MTDKTILPASVEALRTDVIAFINKRFDDLVAPAGAPPVAPHYKMPTLDDGRDARNKNGHNLTERGAELLYRMFDDGAGYNRASKMLNITQAAAKNRKAAWKKAGGVNRKRLTLDVDG